MSKINRASQSPKPSKSPDHADARSVGNSTFITSASQTSPLTAQDVLRLGSVLGNRLMQRTLTEQIVQRKPAPLPPGVLNVRGAINRNDYISQPDTPGGEGEWGAYYYLSQMESEELIMTLGKLKTGERALLLENLTQGEGIFDMQRINTALRGVATNDPTSGQSAVVLDDLINDAQILDYAHEISAAIQKAEAESDTWWGMIDEYIWDVQAPYAAVYQLLAQRTDAELQALFGHLYDSDLVRLLEHLGDAPVEHRARWAALITSAYGRAPDAPIPDDPFSSLFATLIDLSRVDLYKRLRLLSRENRQALLDHIDDAPEASRELIQQVLTDLQGDGTNMESEDVIDLKTVSGYLNRRMAEIYNNYGQYLEEQARDLNITTAAAAGIMKVESGGKTFDPATDLPVIRFENHKLWKFWGQANETVFNQHFKFGQMVDGELKSHLGHMWRPNASGEWQEQHVSADNQEAEWEVVNFAVELAGKETSYMCMSMGAGQMMGFNHAEKAGYSSAVEMFDAFAAGERPQISSIFDFIRRTEGLAEQIQAGNYSALASAYNGEGQVEQYTEWISEAAAAYAQVTQGKQHVFPPSEVPAPTP
jgi:hypothetical protein